MDMKKVMNELYDIESEQDYHQSKTKMLSIAVSCDEASLLRAIADRFGKSVSAFGGEIIEDAIKEAFLFLSDKDRIELADKADADTREYLQKKGLADESRYQINGKYAHWGHYARDWAHAGASPEEIQDMHAAPEDRE